MEPKRLTLLPLMACLAAVSSLAAQTPRREPMSVSAVRGMTKEAEAEARGDKNEIVLALDRRVRERWGDFESFPITIVRREDLSIVLSTPFMTYRRALAEYLRMGDALERIPWIPTAVVAISPNRLEAPDILRVVVERNGKPIPASENLLKPMKFTNGNGDAATLHAGEVRFPMSAFAPGASVKIAAVPASGETFTYELDDSQLGILK
jgi:hypothetical protein